jgi:hypothetical protein
MRSRIRAHGGAVATLLLITAVGCGGRSDAKTHGGFAGAGVVTPPRYPTPHRPQRHRVLRAAGTPLPDHRAHQGLARRMPPPPPPLRTQAIYFLAFTSIACTLICYRRLAR